MQHGKPDTKPETLKMMLNSPLGQRKRIKDITPRKEF
jgi:hypothetical protein